MLHRFALSRAESRRTGTIGSLGRSAYMALVGSQVANSSKIMTPPDGVKQSKNVNAAEGNVVAGRSPAVEASVVRTQVQLQLTTVRP